MKLILANSGERWDQHRDVREHLRSVTRVGHKKHWDCIIMGTWWDLYQFSPHGGRYYAVMLWTGSDKELLMVKLADPKNLIIEAYDLDATDDTLVGLDMKKSHAARLSRISWKYFKKYQNADNLPPLIEELLSNSFEGPY